MFPCHRYSPLPLNRRAFLRQAGCGFGAVALAALLAQNGSSRGAESAARTIRSRRSRRISRRKAKSVIFLYMDGGPSQVDTFDPKPRLSEEHGQPFAMKIEPTQFNNNGSTLGSRRGSSSSTARAACRSATCFRTSPSASTTWRSSAR